MALYQEFPKQMDARARSVLSSVSRDAHLTERFENILALSLGMSCKSERHLLQQTSVYPIKYMPKQIGRNIAECQERN